MQKTAQAIDTACWELIHEKDFDSITVNDIAEKANINRATFYRYHVDKFDWLEKQFDVLMHEIIVTKQSIHPKQDPQILLESFLNIAQHFNKNFLYFYILLQNKGTHFLQVRFQKLLDGFLQPEINAYDLSVAEADLLLHSAAATISGIMEWWIQNNRPLSAEQLAHFLYSLYMKLIK